MAKSPEVLRAEFREKEKILGSYGEQLFFDGFYDHVFHGASDDDRVMLVEAGKRFVAMSRDSAAEYCEGRDDVFVCSAHFYDDFKRDSFIDYLYAFVIDLDNLSPKWLSDILEGIVERGTAPVPTMVVNSGKGVHLYYILDVPLYAYPSVREKARDLYGMLNELFEFTPDKHSIGHAFRPVGALTKLGDVATGYLIGEYWTIEELADAVGYNWYVPDMASREGLPATEKMKHYAGILAVRDGVDEPDYSSFVETHDFIKEHSRRTRRGSVRPEGDSVGVAETDYITEVQPNGSPLWYRKTRDRIIEKTELEHRYKSLMALAVIAYKCNIPFETLERDVDHIVQLWLTDARWSREPFNKKNVPAALRCYSQKFVKVRRTTLEDWLGWRFTGDKPESKYSQTEWLEILADRKSAASLRAIRTVLKQDPSLSKAEIARRAGVSRQTVHKHYAAAMTYVKR